MSSEKKKRSDKKTENVAIGGDSNESEVNQLRKRLEEFEERHQLIKTEFDSLKAINEELTTRHEKTIKELKLDIKIVNKDVEKYKQLYNYVRKEKSDLSEQIKTRNTTEDQLEERLKEKDERIQQLINELDQIRKDLDDKQHKQSIVKEGYEDRIRSLSNETKTLRDQLNKELNWKRKYEESSLKCETNSNKLMELQNQMRELENKLFEKDRQIETKDNENKKLSNKCKILETQCEKMDTQLNQFQNKYKGLGVQKQKLIADKDSTVSEVNKLNKEICNLRNQLDAVDKEREDTMAELESQRVHYEELIKTERQKLLTTEQEFQSERQKTHKLEERFSAQEQNIYTNDETIIALDKKVSQLEEQLIAIKEEAASHITTIGHLKETNDKLKSYINVANDNIDDLEGRLISIANDRDVKEDEINQLHIRSEQTIKQLKNAIMHLQQKYDFLEKKQKKKFMGLALTPKKKGSADYDINCPIDLDKALAEEKAINKKLLEELTKLKSDANYLKNEVFQLNDSINTDDLNDLNDKLSNESNDVNQSFELDLWEQLVNDQQNQERQHRTHTDYSPNSALHVDILDIHNQ
ncbi:uncharacterized protein LOC128965637 [Oppia nitens]|uniref:uncharacterized protein LOC128965637 n=1 Tax=Oppia nitens TaxID=1686743 RepID=UPI0023DBA235|nr:uncharacterized protein LOC128965637 [Oppia nitens]